MTDPQETAPASRGDVTVTHSPTPWSLFDSWVTWPHKRGVHERDLMVLADDTTEPSICHVASVPPEERDVMARELANAEFIVLACNQHEALVQQRDALLAALRDIYVAFDVAIAIGLIPCDTEHSRIAEAACRQIQLADEQLNHREDPVPFSCGSDGEK